jgi:hypothetical protein
MAQRSHWQDERDWAYAEAVYPRLVRKYPNRWIALAQHRVIASGKDVTKVLAQARRKVAWEEIPLVFVERGIHVYPLARDAA